MMTSARACRWIIPLLDVSTGSAFAVAVAVPSCCCTFSLETRSSHKQLPLSLSRVPHVPLPYQTCRPDSPRRRIIIARSLNNYRHNRAQHSTAQHPHHHHRGLLPYPATQLPYPSTPTRADGLLRLYPITACAILAQPAPARLVSTHLPLKPSDISFAAMGKS
jgi:hypothetical protein